MRFFLLFLFIFISPKLSAVIFIIGDNDEVYIQDEDAEVWRPATDNDFKAGEVYDFGPVVAYGTHLSRLQDNALGASVETWNGRSWVKGITFPGIFKKDITLSVDSKGRVFVLKNANLQSNKIGSKAEFTTPETAGEWDLAVYFPKENKLAAYIWQNSIGGAPLINVIPTADPATILLETAYGSFPLFTLEVSESKSTVFLNVNEHRVRIDGRVKSEVNEIYPGVIPIIEGTTSVSPSEDFYALFYGKKIRKINEDALNFTIREMVSTHTEWSRWLFPLKERIDKQKYQVSSMPTYSFKQLLSAEVTSGPAKSKSPKNKLSKSKQKKLSRTLSPKRTTTARRNLSQEHSEILQDEEEDEEEVEENSPSLRESDFSPILRGMSPAIDLALIFKELPTLEQRVNAKLVEQTLITKTMVKLWGESLLGTDQKARVKSMILLGPTGAGKSESGKVFAQELFGPDAGQKLGFLEIDLTKFSGNDEVNASTLFGPSPNYVGYGETKGVLIDFILQNKNRGKVILLNELDKVSTKVVESLMEVIDTGEVKGMDGGTYPLGNVLFIFTSNKADDQIFPRDRELVWDTKLRDSRLGKVPEKRLREILIRKSTDDKNLKSLAPSFVARIDVVQAALPPTFIGALTIGYNEAHRLQQDGKKFHGIDIGIDKVVLKDLVDTHYKPENGVRNIVKLVKSTYVQCLTQGVTAAKAKSGDRLFLKANTFKTSTANTPFVLQKNDQKKTLPFNLASNNEQPNRGPPHLAKIAASLEVFKSSFPDQPRLQSLVTRHVIPSVFSTVADTVPPVLVLGATKNETKTLLSTFAEIGQVDPLPMEIFSFQGADFGSSYKDLFGHMFQNLAVQNRDNPGRFEQFLNDNPGGGLLVFEGVSNLRPAGESENSSILNQFTEMLKDRTWLSPSGKKFDLKRFKLIFFADSSPLFNELETDSLRLSRWEQSSRSEVTSSFLSNNAGWPEEFLRRLQANTVVMQPRTVEKIKKDIQRNMTQTLKRIQENLKIGSLKIGQKFVETIFDRFYSRERGEEYLATFYESILPGLFATILVKKKNHEFLVGKNLEVAFSTTPPDLKGDEQSQPMLLDLIDKSRTRPRTLLSIDISDYAVDRMHYSELELMKISLHEAGHIIANDSQQTGFTYDHVQIDEISGKHLAAHNGSKNSVYTRSTVVAVLANHYGGYAAERAFGIEISYGLSSDFRKATEYAQEAVKSFLAGDPALSQIEVSEDLEDTAEIPPNNNLVQALLKEGLELADKRVLQFKSTLIRIASALYNKRSLDRIEIQNLLDDSSPTLSRCESNFLGNIELKQ